MPTTSAAIVEPIHSSCIACASSVMPSGQPQLSQLPATSSYEHPLSVSAPRRPSPATFACLLRRATARCLLFPSPAAPGGLTGGGPPRLARRRPSPPQSPGDYPTPPPGPGVGATIGLVGVRDRPTATPTCASG